MSDLTYFVSKFEDMASENGTLAWHEDDLMQALGYSNRSGFRKVMRRAMQACLTLNIEPSHDFILVGDSYKFTRFACYLIAMSAEAKKPQVAMVQVYLSTFANSVYDYREQAEIVDRLRYREELKEGMKSLAETAHQHGVVHYGSFVDAGYRGMYNMRLTEIEALKGVGTREHLLDRMGRTELAANFLRVTLTDDKIKLNDVQGQAALEKTAHEVGQGVRGLVVETIGRRPEDMPLAEHVEVAKKTLKSAGKKLKQIGREEATPRCARDRPRRARAPSPGRASPEARACDATRPCSPRRAWCPPRPPRR
jgi:DNA-damage-inducible protein D